MFTESDLLPISALQHIVFCERQCALIHTEQAWAENRLTAEGRILHERVHKQATESRRDCITACGLKLRSLALGLTGVADIVEFYKTESGGVALPGRRGLWKPFPVEYKRGKPKTDGCDEVQLCAQALCLEEMLNATIESGALFYGSQRRRKEVVFNDALRECTQRTAVRLHALIDSAAVPVVAYQKKCDSCSLLDICLPRTSVDYESVNKYLDDVLEDYSGVPA